MKALCEELSALGGDVESCNGSVMELRKAIKKLNKVKKPKKVKKEKKVGTRELQRLELVKEALPLTVALKAEGVQYHLDYEKVSEWKTIPELRKFIKFANQVVGKSGTSEKKKRGRPAKKVDATIKVTTEVTAEEVCEVTAEEVESDRPSTPIFSEDEEDNMDSMVDTALNDLASEDESEGGILMSESESENGEDLFGSSDEM